MFQLPNPVEKINTYQAAPEGLNDGMPPTHPGEILAEELGYLNVAPSTFAEMIGGHN